jgi:geranylgeranyl diphosphate synthase type II
MLSAPEFDAYLTDCRELTLRELQTIIPTGGRYGSVLYDLMLEYPLREAKALRPALCIATCRALGGSLEAVLHSAAILELYHNAFLIHDDVEDGSEHRRDHPTLHTMHGVPIAVNVGDAMLALALEPLLDNMRLIGMGKALRILQVIARMARESTEGQAIELHWIRQGEWGLRDADYIRMVYKKTSWYTFMAPVLIGAIVAGATADRLAALRRFAALLGIAFQIQDDLLNLVAEGGRYGKEIAGDLWEGKHTLILMHALREATVEERGRALAILAKPRPVPSSGTNGSVHKTADDVQSLVAMIDRYRSVGHARAVAGRYAGKAQRLMAAAGLVASVHRRFLEGLIGFVVTRDR